jgi:hypothetical protein
MSQPNGIQSSNQPGVALGDFVERTAVPTRDSGDLIPKSVLTVSQPTAPSLRIDGNSLASAVEHLNNPTDRSWSKLCKLLGAQERNYGIGGTALVSSGTSILQGWARPFSDVMSSSLPTSGNLVDLRPLSPAALQQMVNDMGLANRGDQVNIVATYRAAAIAWTRLMRAGFKWRNVGDGSPFTYSGGFANNAADNNFGGTYAHRGATSGSVTFAPPTANGFVGGNLTFYFAVCASPLVRMRAQARINTGPYIATLDATDRGGLHPERALGCPGAYSVASLTVPVAPAQAGNTYTVTVDLDEVSGGVNFLGCTLETLPEFLPLLLLIGQPYLAQMPQGQEPTLSAANLDAGNAALAQIAADYTDGRCRFVDLMSMRGDQGNNNAVYFQDGVHFLPEGNAEVVRLTMAEIVGSRALVPGYTGGPPEFAGQPTWSGQAGDTSYDPATGITWVAHSATMGDWTPTTLPAVAAAALSADMAAITANTVLEDITGLGLAIGASTTEIWLVKWWLLVAAANATMDIKFGMTLPAGATMKWGSEAAAGTSGNSPGAVWGAAPVAASSGLLGSGASSLVIGTLTAVAANPMGIHFTAIVFGGGTAGLIQPQFAQNTSDAGALQILKGSLMEASKLAS